MKSFVHNIFLHHQVSKRRHLISLVVLIILSFAFGIMLTLNYFGANKKVNTVTKLVQELPLTKDMKIVSNFIKDKSPYTPVKVADAIAYQVVSQSKIEGAPHELIIGIIVVESNCNPYAVSSKGARGLMQVLTKECSNGDVDVTELFDVSYNISMGICILKDFIKEQDGDLGKALFRYVGGDESYKDKVLKYMGEFMLYKETNK